MSSSPDRFGRVRFALGLTGWFLIIFLITAIGLYLVTARLVRSALDEEWQTKQAVVKEWVTPRGELEGVSVRTVETKAVPTPEIQAAVKRQFERYLPILMLPLIVVGLVGGVIVTNRSTRNLRSVVRTVGDILAKGEIQRRLAPGKYHGAWKDLARLFNRALDRNEALITRLHESLDAVAHDLRTPMTRLRSTAESALEAPEDSGVCREAISDCLEESESVLAMLNSLMDVAEAETGAMRLDREEVGVDEIIDSVVDLYEVIAEEKDMKLETDVPDDLTLEADRSRLRQVVANLVDNAIKYAPPGTTVALRARADGDDVVFEVADAGPGIPPIDLPKIWNRLYRGDRSRHERGLGLGLSFVKAIVEAHGGRVSVDTREGEGSTFCVRLPRAA